MRRSQKALAGFWMFAGTMHFVIPRSYQAMMPKYLPYHREAVAVSGAAEIAGGVAVLSRRTRHPFARWWLLGVLAAVFPANIWMATKPEEVAGLDLDKVPRWALLARLPLQPLLALWVWRATDE